MHIALIHYDGFLFKNITSYLNNNSYHISLISSDYFDNQDKINIKLKNVDIVMHIIDDYFYSLKSSNYEKSLDIFSNIMTKIEIAINSNETKPKMFIQTSLSLIYKSKNINDETSISFSNSLISNISNLVEDKANNLREQGVKVAILRMANILSKDGGMINKMNFFSKIRMYPKALKTKKYIDWVHIDDVISSIEFIISNNYFGVFNITSPSLGIYKELSSLIIKDKKIFSLPNFLFKRLFFYGYLVSMENNKIIPKRLLDNGFKFKYEKLSSIENF